MPLRKKGLGKKSRKQIRQRMAVTSKRRWRPGQVAIREIKKYQESVERLIPFRPFYKAAKTIMMMVDPSMKISQEAMKCLQEASEAFMVGLFEES